MKFQVCIKCKKRKAKAGYGYILRSFGSYIYCGSCGAIYNFKRDIECKKERGEAC